MKQPKNSLQLPKPTKNNHKIVNKWATASNGKTNFQTKDDLICHVAKVKAATSANSMAKVIPFQLKYI